MKKSMVFIFSFFCVISLFGGKCYAEEKSDEEKTSIEYIVNNVHITSMNYEGENEKWLVRLVVEKAKSESGEIVPRAKLMLIPKKSAVEWVTCSMITKSGSNTDQEWQVYYKPIEMYFYECMPTLDGDVRFKIYERYSREQYYLALQKNLPAGMISPTEAVEKMVKQYYKNFGKYPSEEYTYFIDLYEGDWLISYDDNDNIGGKTYILVDGDTGYIDSMKQEE